MALHKQAAKRDGFVPLFARLVLLPLRGLHPSNRNLVHCGECLSIKDLPLPAAFRILSTALAGKYCSLIVAIATAADLPLVCCGPEIQELGFTVCINGTRALRAG